MLNSALKNITEKAEATISNKCVFGDISVSVWDYVHGDHNRMQGVLLYQASMSSLSSLTEPGARLFVLAGFVCQLGTSWSYHREKSLC